MIGLGPALYHGDEGYSTDSSAPNEYPCPCIFCGHNCDESCEELGPEPNQEAA